MKNKLLSKLNKVATKAPKNVDAPNIILFNLVLDLSCKCSKDIDDEIVCNKKGIKIKKFKLLEKENVNTKTKPTIK